MLKLFILGAIALGVICHTEASIFEDLSYEAAKQILIARGWSEVRADCFVTTWKYTGPADDIINSSKSMDQMLKNLNDKAKFANFVCSPYGIIVIVLIFCFFFGCLCACCKRRRTVEPKIIHLTSPQFLSKNVAVPYERMNNV